MNAEKSPEYMATAGKTKAKIFPADPVIRELTVVFRTFAKLTKQCSKCSLFALSLTTCDLI